MRYCQGYGMVEEDHGQIIEAHLQKAFDGIVVELGCGETLFDKKSRYAKKYYAVDRFIEREFKDKVGDSAVLLCADAKNLPFCSDLVDLVLAFGLFGNLDIYASTSDAEQVILNQVQVVEGVAGEFLNYMSRPPVEVLLRRADGRLKVRVSETQFRRLVKAEWKKTWCRRCQMVVDEVHRILVVGGTFIISNNRERQPMEEFRTLFRHFDSVKIVVGQERYLIVVIK